MSNSATPATTPTRSVVVIGGGLAGMAAALALAQRGVRVTLLEAKRRLGGRTGSFSLPSVTGETERDESIDYCQHVAMGCCTNLRQFVDWLGQSEHWLEHRELHFLSSNGVYQRLRPLPLLPAPLHIGHWLLRWPNLSWLDRLAAARGLLAMWRLRLDDTLDQIPAMVWLKQHGQTAGSLQHFWSTIMVSALGAELEAVNLAAATKVIQDGFLKHREAFHVLVPQRSLDDLFNRDALLKLQQAGVRVELSSPAKQIVLTDGKQSVASHAISGIDVITGSGTHRADACVVAVPWHAIGRLAAQSNVAGLKEIAQRAAGLGNSPITGIHTWWDRPWLELPNAAIVGRLCQWVFAAPDGMREPLHDRNSGQVTDSHYYQIVISASHHLPTGDPDDLKRMVMDDLAELFPASRDASLLRFKAVTDPQAVFSIGPGTMGLRPFTTPLGPQVLLAGDWTRTGWPATMEGAVLSGFRAAEAFLANCGSPVSIVADPLGGPKKRP